MAQVESVIFGRFEVQRLDLWREFMGVFYGLELKPSLMPGEFEAVVDDSGARLLFREGPAEDLIANGWICRDLDGLKARLESCGQRAEWASEAEAHALGSNRLLRTVDPEGLTIEVMDKTASHQAYSPPAHQQTFKTGSLGVGHFTFQTADLDRFERFYTEALGLDITDYNDLTLLAGVRVKVGFYRANPRHHSIGCASFGIPSRKRLNHFFLELPDHDSVGRAFERIQEKRIPIAHEIGVHPNDNLFTFYVITPSGFQAEIGAEGRLVEAPEPVLTHRGMARWGHRMPSAQKLRMVPTVARAAAGQLRKRFAS